METTAPFERPESAAHGSARAVRAVAVAVSVAAAAAAGTFALRLFALRLFALPLFALSLSALSLPAVAAPSPSQEQRVASSAATLYALNCMGCHPAPRTREHDRGPLRGEFFHSEMGRNFFIRMPSEGRRLTTTEEAHLLEEVLTWKRACAAIRQNAPMVDYQGERHVR